ncbi:hypothetical protein ACFWSJ_25525 [Streptomyces niveus]|uniref:hypothetical protein n=1 Tax=Streptomyces niveus TaxID=193462 RepID=UPI003665D026
MTLNFETGEPVVGLARQRELIEAVLGASSADESRWLEWKSWHDVSKAEGAFAVSKAILGFANRMPDVAAQWAEGHAYLLVGVEERVLHGVTAYDIEKVDAWLGRYLGGFGRYQLTYVPVDNGEGTKQVMLVDVSPPRWGDPLHTLHKEYQHFRPGTVFHRYTGRTEPARPAEIEALTERARRATTRVSVDVTLTAGTVALVAPTEGLRGRIIGHYREALMKQLDNSPAEPDSGAAGAWSSTYNLLRTLQNADHRSADTFRKEVEEYLDDLDTAVQQALVQQIRAAGSPVTLKLSNPEDQNLTKVQVVLSLPDTVSAHFTDDDGGVDWPTPPREYGTATLPIGAGVLTRTAYPGPHAFPPPRPDSPSIEQEEGCTVIRFSPVHLRPHETLTLAPVTLHSTQEADTGTITGQWQATATNLGGRVQRSLPLPTQRLELAPPVLFGLEE